MRLITSHAGGSALVHQSTSDTSKFILDLTPAGGVDSSTLLGSFLYEILVSLSLWRNGRNQSIYRGIPLSAVAEFDAADEGGVPFQATGTSAQGIQVPIPVCLGGAIDLDGDSHLRIEITNIPAGWTANLNSIAGPVVDTKVIDCDRIVVQKDNVTQEFPLIGYRTLLIPVTERIEAIDLDYSNGKSDQLTYSDLLVIAAQANDTVFVNTATNSFFFTDQGNSTHMSSFAFHNFFVVDVSTVTRMRVTKTTDFAQEFFVFGETTVADASRANIVNAALVDTTAGN